MNTLPSSAIKTLNHYIQLHQIFPKSALSPSSDFDSYSFDLKDVIFDGPFCRDEDFSVLIEHRHNKNPNFSMVWKNDILFYLYIFFYKNNTTSSPAQHMLIWSSSLTIYDYENQKELLKYEVKSDGSLGKKFVLG